MSNILIVFYSLEGNTRFIAEILKAELLADLLEIKPKNEITSRGLMKYLWGGRQVYMGVKPDLLPFEINLDNYENIIIGTPVWAFTFSPPIRSFISQIQIKNKNLALFCTSGGSRGKTLENLKTALKDNRFIGEEEFINVLTNKEKNLLKAKNWAEKLKASLQQL